MTEADRVHWDNRHAEHGPAPADAAGPPPLFAPYEHLLPRAGRALELACGRGRGAVWLAGRGLHVSGLDISPVAVKLATELAERSGVGDRCTFEVVDLDDGLPPGPPVDVILCDLFRDSRLDQAIIDRLAPGGLLIMAVLSEVDTAPGPFRARPGELLAAFAELEVLAAGERGGEAWLIAKASHSDGMEEIADGDTVWRFDVAFLRSNWTCVFGRGCLGILPEPAEHLGHGCCSMGADLDGIDEARTIAALAATLPPVRFERHDEAARNGVLTDDRTATRVVDGACIFLNRPGFVGGAGCALHLAALDASESQIDWKPSVCWQLPIKVDWVDGPGDTEVATVRRWTRADWGAEGETMAWCCTEGDRAYVGDRTVLESLGDEIEALVGTAVHVELRRRLMGGHASR